MDRQPSQHNEMDNSKKHESRPEALLLGGIGLQETATGGWLVPGVASESLNPIEGVSSLALSVSTTSAETVMSSGTQWNPASDGEMETDRTSSKSKLMERLQQPAPASLNPPEENALFLKYLQLVFTTVKKLEMEVGNAKNIQEC